MKKVLALLLCLATPLGAGMITTYTTSTTTMTITYVYLATTTTTTTTSTTTTTMAPALSISSQTWSGSATQSWSMNCQGGNFLVCGYVDPFSGTVATGMTYGGASMTYSTQTVNGAGPNSAGIYYLANPASGSQTVAITGLSGAANGGCVCFSDSETPTYDSGSPICSTAGSGTSASMNVTTAVNNEYIVDVIYNNNGTAVTASGSQIAQWTGGSSVSDAGSTLSVPTAGTNAMAWTSSGFGQVSHCAIAVKP